EPATKAPSPAPAQATEKPAETASPAAPAEITFWGSWGGDVEKSINVILDKYNATSATKVKYVVQSDIMTTFATANATGDVPDIMLWDASEVSKYAQKGVLAPINDKLAGASINKGDYNSECIRELTLDDKLYGLPLNIDIWGIYVNLDIIKSLGLSAPTTWDELKEDAIQATQRDSSGKLIRAGLSMQWFPYEFTSFMVADGASVLSDDGKTTTVNNDTGRKVLSLFKGLLDAGVYDIGFESGLSQGEDAFLTGRSAMVVWPTSMLRTYQTYGDKMDFTFAPIPAGPDPGARIGGIQTSFCFVIPAKSKNIDAAFDFMKFSLHDVSNSISWCQIVGGLSPLIAAQNDPFFANNKYYANVLSGINGLKIRPKAPGFIQVEGSVFAPNIQELFEGTLSIDDCLKNMQTDGDTMLAQYRNE
ncbi:MAG TPA: extracellular solute-binding protein, partial [Anaerolineae bacterium]|nr:extracellular solute-binding protein [Anaerolineae bacterium]